MDFLKILRSLEEFLYEVITWLVFYPRTLWRVLRHPLITSGYARSQVDDNPDNPFSDSISPPLFLMLTVMILQTIAFAMHKDGAPLSNPLAQLVFGNEQYQLIYLSVAYCLWPLIFSAGVLRLSQQPLNRETLRSPFFAQCFIVAPFALGVNVGLAIIHQASPAAILIGLILLVATFTWYISTQTLWLSTELSYPKFKSFALAMWYFTMGVGFNAAISYILRTF